MNQELTNGPANSLPLMNNQRDADECNIISERLAEKECTRCGRVLPATREHFYADQRLSDGLYNACKSCQSALTNKDITRTSYKMMVQRCTNPNSPNYRYYGAKGIQISDEWRASFKQFLADMGPRPSRKHSIGRIGDVGNYCKGNCSWQTREEQAEEQRRKLRRAA